MVCFKTCTCTFVGWYKSPQHKGLWQESPHNEGPSVCYILLCYLFLLRQTRVHVQKYISIHYNMLWNKQSPKENCPAHTGVRGVCIHNTRVVSSHLPCPLFPPLVSAPQLYTEPPVSSILISGTSQCLTWTCHIACHIIQKTLCAIQYILTLPVSGTALTSLSPFLSLPLGISFPSCPCQKWLPLVPLSAHPPSAPASLLPQPAQSD